MPIDLNAALSFVNERIETEAKLDGEPLSDNERVLLHHLPTAPLIPPWPGGESSVITPRDLPYERLCAIAKAAYSNDLRLNPDRAAEWQFAAAVSRLNGHPMAWLLEWAGVKLPKPWWDRWLLVIVAIVVVAFGLTCLILADGQPWTSARFISAIFIALAVLLTIYLGSRHIETWQLKQTIENCRRTARVT